MTNLLLKLLAALHVILTLKQLRDNREKELHANQHEVQEDNQSSDPRDAKAREEQQEA